MASVESLETVQKIYIAYYGRPADPAGLNYWANRLEAEGGDLTNIIDHFATSEESNALYGGDNITNEAAIEAIYSQLFARMPDQEGKAFYLAELEDPESHVTLQSIALDVLLGAQGNDATVVANKLEFAQHFTGSLDESDPLDGLNEQLAYSGDDAVAMVRALMATVDATSEALSTALHDIPNLIDDLVGRSRSFTSAADNLVGGDTDDLFTVSESGTLQSTDTVDGKGGFDVLEILVPSLNTGSSESQYRQF